MWPMDYNFLTPGPNDHSSKPSLPFSIKLKSCFPGFGCSEGYIKVQKDPNTLSQDLHSNGNSPTTLRVSDHYAHGCTAPVNHTYKLKTKKRGEQNGMINGRQLLILVVVFLYRQFRTN